MSLPSSLPHFLTSLLPHSSLAFSTCSHRAIPDLTQSRERLLEALETLTPVRREVVLLHDLEGWTHPEIADALGMTELSSRQHLFQARRELRDHLGEACSAGGVT